MNEIAKYQTMPLQNAADIKEIGRLFETGLSLKVQGQGAIMLMTCMSEGISPIQFQRKYHMLPNGPSMRYDAMLADFVTRGGEYEIIERSAERAALKLVKGKRAMVSEFTMADAKDESYAYAKDGKDGKKFKDNWSTPRRRMQMLWARAVSDGVRVVDPGVVAGIYTPEEVNEFADDTGAAKDVPRPIVEPPPKRKPQAQPEQGEVIEAEYVEDAEPDYTVVPGGNFKGQPWTALDAEKLEAFDKSSAKILTDGHRAEIKKAMAGKGQK